VQQSFLVAATQTITFTSTAPSSAVVGGTYTPSATATSGLTVTIDVEGSSAAVCSMSLGAVHFFGAGTCTLDAVQAGDASYAPATEVDQSFSVALQGHAITFTSTAPAAAAVGGATYTPSATATSGLTVTISVDGTSSSVCTISVAS